MRSRDEWDEVDCNEDNFCSECGKRLIHIVEGDGWNEPRQEYWRSYYE